MHEITHVANRPSIAEGVSELTRFARDVRDRGDIFRRHFPARMYRRNKVGAALTRLPPCTGIHRQQGKQDFRASLS